MSSLTGKGQLHIKSEVGAATAAAPPARRRTVGQSNQECKETSRIKCVSHVEKLKLRFLHEKKIKLSGSITHLFLETTIVQNKKKSINTKEPFRLKF